MEPISFKSMGAAGGRDTPRTAWEGAWASSHHPGKLAGGGSDLSFCLQALAAVKIIAHLTLSPASGPDPVLTA